MTIHTPAPYSREAIDIFLREIAGFINLSEQDKENIRLVYTFADLLHHDEKRKDNSDYFEHPKEVAKILKEIVESPSAQQVVIALLHDLIENTAVEYHLLKHLFGQEIADAVRKVSKKCWTLYLKDIPASQLSPDQLAQISSLKQQDPIHEILTPEEIDDDEINIVFSGENFLGKKDKIENFLYASTRLFGVSTDIKFDIIIIDARHKEKEEIAVFIAEIFSDSPYGLKISFHEYTKKENLAAYKGFSQETKTLARKARDIDYFQNMGELPDEVLMVKFADRIHNLRSISGLSVEKKQKLLEETKKYFLPVAVKRNKKAHSIMVELCAEIEASIQNLVISSIVNT